MPRLTNQEYLKRRWRIRTLYDDWHSQAVFGYLSSNMQKVLYEYYATAKDLTDKELIEYRKEHQELAFSAGKAYAKLIEVLAGKHEEKRVLPIMRSEIDIEKLMKALFLLADQMSKDPELKAEFEKAVAKKKRYRPVS